MVPPFPDPEPGGHPVMFPAYTQAHRDLDLPEGGIRVLSKITPDFLFDLQGVGELCGHEATGSQRREAAGRGQDQGTQL